MRYQSATIARIVLLILLAVIVFTTPAQSGDIKHIDRKEAIKILEAEGYTNIIIGAIVERFSLLGVGGTNTAVVTGIAKKEGKSVKLGGDMEFEMFIYDRQIGWCNFDIEWDKKTNEYMFILYTKKGKKILRHEK
jgi:hypothetical protein